MSLALHYSITAQCPRLRNDLYCVECDVTIPYHQDTDDDLMYCLSRYFVTYYTLLVGIR